MADNDTDADTHGSKNNSSSLHPIEQRLANEHFLNCNTWDAQSFFFPVQARKVKCKVCPSPRLPPQDKTGNGKNGRCFHAFIIFPLCLHPKIQTSKCKMSRHHFPSFSFTSASCTHHQLQVVSYFFFSLPSRRGRTSETVICRQIANQRRVSRCSWKLFFFFSLKLCNFPRVLWLHRTRLPFIFF